MEKDLLDPLENIFFNVTGGEQGFSEHFMPDEFVKDEEFYYEADPPRPLGAGRLGDGNFNVEADLPVPRGRTTPVDEFFRQGEARHSQGVWRPASNVQKPSGAGGPSPMQEDDVPHPPPPLQGPPEPMTVDENEERISRPASLTWEYENPWPSQTSLPLPPPPQPRSLEQPSPSYS